MFLLRLLVGLLKGVVVGAAVGFGMVSLGMAVPSVAMAYVSAAVCGLLIALVAGKPIWAKDARIEVGMKAFAGALLAPGLLFLVRRFMAVDLPADLLAGIPGLESVKGASLSLSSFAVTSLAVVTAVLAGFFDADNQPTAEDEKGASGKKRIASAGKRVATEQAEELHEEEADAARRARR